MSDFCLVLFKICRKKKIKHPSVEMLVEDLLYFKPVLPYLR